MEKKIYEANNIEEFTSQLKLFCGDSPSVRNFLDNFASFSADSLEVISKNTDPYDYDEYPNLQDYFNYLDEGSYKVAFDDIDGYVVKFCHDDNPTFEEEAMLRRAEEDGFGDFFIPTLFYYLPQDQELADNDGNWYTTIVVQPIVDIISKQDNIEVDFYDHKEDIYYDSIKGKEFMDLNVDSLEWFDAIANKYGDDFIRVLINWFHKYDIGDLHNGNLGFYNGQPIILDYFSNSAIN